MTIDDDSTAVVRTRTEAVHKAKRANLSTYTTARRDTAQFILAVIKNMWVRELRYPETLYIDVAPKALFVHLQAGYTGRHTLNLLALHNEMQCYHLEVEGIPEYINILEDAQKQAGRSSQTIADKTLLLFMSTAMLTIERYPQANDDWEDKSEDENTWAHWKNCYKKAHTKARVKSQAAEGAEKFGAANAAKRDLIVCFEKNSGVTTDDDSDAVDLKSLKG